MAEARQQMGPGARDVYQALTWYLDEIERLARDAQANVVRNPGRALEALAQALVYHRELADLVARKLEPLLQRKAARQDAEQAAADLAERVAGLEAQIAEVLRRLPADPPAPSPVLTLHRREG